MAHFLQQHPGHVPEEELKTWVCVKHARAGNIFEEAYAMAAGHGEDLRLPEAPEEEQRQNGGDDAGDDEEPEELEDEEEEEAEESEEEEEEDEEEEEEEEEDGEEDGEEEENEEEADDEDGAGEEDEDEAENEEELGAKGADQDGQEDAEGNDNGDNEEEQKEQEGGEEQFGFKEIKPDAKEQEKADGANDEVPQVAAAVESTKETGGNGIQALGLCVNHMLCVTIYWTPRCFSFRHCLPQALQYDEFALFFRAVSCQKSIDHCRPSRFVDVT